MRNFLSKALPNQVRRLDKERACVAAEAGYDLLREWMQTVVVQVVVVSRIECRAGARRPTKQRLRSQSRVERVVVENQSRERGLRELICAAERQDLDVVSHTIGIVASQALRVDAELRAQLVRRLVSNTAVELKQAATTGIERRILSECECRRTNARVLAAVSKIEIEVTPAMGHLPIELNLLAELRSTVERQVLLARRTLIALAIERTLVR